MPSVARCSSCTFQFVSGHSHDSGTSAAICTLCKQRYALRPESRWGPGIGERLELLVATQARKRRPYHEEPTGVFLTTRAGVEGGVHDPFDEVRCPKCESIGALRGS